MAEDRDKNAVDNAAVDGCTIQQGGKSDISAEVINRAGDADKTAEHGSDKPVSDNSENAGGKELKPDKKGYGNLIPSSMRTPEERRKIAVKAGKASGESRRKRRTAKEIARTILQTCLLYTSPSPRDS